MVVVSWCKLHVVGLACGVVGHCAPAGGLVVASAGEVGSCVWGHLLDWLGLLTCYGVRWGYGSYHLVQEGRCCRSRC